MRLEFLEIGPVPANEDCQQVGPNYRPEYARIEADNFVNQIKEQFPDYKKVRIGIHVNYGNYTTFEVGVWFDPMCEISAQQAFRIESEVWPNWRGDRKQNIQDLIESYFD